MKASKKSAAALAGVATACAPAAFAEATAVGVADKFRELANSAGFTVEYANERAEPGLVVLEDAVIVFPQDEPLTEMKLEWLKFSETGDGAVAITVPDEIPISRSGGTNWGYSGKAGGKLASAGLRTLVEGSGESWAISTAADNISIALEDGLSSTSIEQDGVSYELRVQGGEVERASVSGSAASLRISEADRLEEAASETEFKNLRWVGELSGAFLESEPNNYEINPDFLQVEYDRLEYFQPPPSQGRMGFAYFSGDGKLSFRRVSAQALEVSFQESDSELKYGESVGLEIGSIAVSLQFLEKPAADELNVEMSMDTIALRDAFFDLLDRSRAFPRDPGSFSANASVKFRSGWLDELFEVSEPRKKAEAQDMAQLLVQGVNASWLGAEIGVAGDVRFEAPGAEGNTPPVPVGALDVQLDGMLALLDMSVEAGAIEVADAAGMRILIAGLGERAADREDSYLFRLEFLPEGQMLVNGQVLPF